MKKCVLGELMEVTRGVSLAGKYYATSGEKVRLTLANFDYSNNCFKADTSKNNIYYTQEVDDRFLLHEGDIITPLTEQTPGLLGTTARIPESGKYIQSQDVALLRPFEDKLDSDFCFYLVSSKSVREQLGAMSQQTKIRHSSPDKIKACTVFLPDIAEQKKIGRFLSTLDRKIALNRKRIATLEAMAKVIYDYWFVQFDFPDANGCPYKSSGGAMVYNPDLKREIPKGWEVGDFSDLIDFTMGQLPAGSTLNESGDGVLFFQGSTDFGSFFPSPRQFTNSPVRMAKAGDVLLSVRAPVGTLNFAFEDCCIGRGIGAFRGKIVSNLFTWFYLKSLKPYFDSKNVAGTTFGSIGKDDFKMLRSAIPLSSILRAYSDLSDGIFEQMKLYERAIINDQKIRDFLLPLLMNGQVKVG